MDIQILIIIIIIIILILLYSDRTVDYRLDKNYKAIWKMNLAVNVYD